MIEMLRKQKEVKFTNFGTGRVLPLEDVADPVFATGRMGHGYALELEDGFIRAPFDGIVTMVFPTGHALGLTHRQGMEILLHLGLDTVQLEGKGFETLVVEDQEVVQGQLLSIMDLELIEQEGKSTVSLCLFTSGEIIELVRKYDRVTPESVGIIKCVTL